MRSTPARTVVAPCALRREELIAARSDPDRIVERRQVEKTQPDGSVEIVEDVGRDPESGQAGEQAEGPTRHKHANYPHPAMPGGALFRATLGLPRPYICR